MKDTSEFVRGRGVWELLWKCVRMMDKKLGGRA